MRTENTGYPIWHMILLAYFILFFLNYISHLCSQFFPQFSFFIIKFQLTHLAESKNVKNLFSFSHFFWVLKIKMRTKNKSKKTFP